MTEAEIESLAAEFRTDALHTLRMDHGHTTANEMQRCGTCTRRAEVLTDVLTKLLWERVDS